MTRERTDAPARPGRADRTGGPSGPSTATYVGVAMAVVVVAIVGVLRPAIVRGVLGSPRAILIVLGIIAAAVGVSALLRRVGTPEPVRIGALAVMVAATLGVTVAPYFAADEVVDEALPGGTDVAVAAQAGPASDDPAFDDPALTGSADATTGDAAPTAPEAAGPVGSVGADGGPAAGAGAGTATAEDGGPGDASPAAAEGAQSPSTGPVELSRGTFVGLDGHSASGQAAVYTVDGELLVRLDQVDLQRVPDAHVYLVPTADAQSPGDGAVYLGPLTGNVGSSNYQVPAGTRVGPDMTVLVWCEAFASPVGGATQTPTT